MGRMRIEIEAGPAFRANAMIALGQLIEARHDGPTKDVLKRLRDGVASSFYEADPPEAGDMSRSDGLGG